MSILVSAAVVGTVGGGAYYFARGRKAAEGREWVEESVKAWRSKDLDGDRFQVHIKDAHLADVFTTFDHDNADPYYSPDDIEEKFSHAIGSAAPRKALDATELAVIRVMEAAEDVKQDYSERASQKAPAHSTRAQKAWAACLAGAGTVTQVAKQGARGSVRLSKALYRGARRIPGAARRIPAAVRRGRSQKAQQGGADNVPYARNAPDHGRAE